MAWLSAALSGLQVSDRVSTRPEDHLLGAASLGRVKTLGHYSTGEKKEFLDDKSQLRYINLPSNRRLSWDLSRGYSKPWTPYTNPHLNSVCEWMRRQPCLPKTDFVARRAIFTHIAHTPYSTDLWTIAIVRVNDTFFLTECKLDEVLNLDEQLRKMSYWGYKFESYLCAKNMLDIEGAVNCNKSFRLVRKRRLGKHEILIAAEIDCMDKMTGELVELKTCKHLVSPKQEGIFHRYKTVKWWIQSALIDVPRIIVGNRSEDGFVESLTEWKVDALAAEGRSRGGWGWDSRVCLNFADAVLDLIKGRVTENNHKQVWLVERKEGTSHISAPRRLRGRENEDYYSFFPKDFLASL